MTAGLTLRILAYGLIAAASPLALAATLVVLRTTRARLNGFLFAAAFLCGGGLVVLVIGAIGAVAAPGEGGSSTVATVLELLLGVLLVAAGLAAARHHSDAPSPTTQRADTRTAAVLERLEGLTPATSFGAGALLGIGGPKRLTVSIVTATTIAAAELGRPQAVAEGALYVVVGALLVWVPVAVYLVAGRRSRAWMSVAEEWLTARERTIAVVLLLVFGTLLTTDALTELL